MYNSIIILFCVFAVYGAYAMLREISLLLIRKNRIVAAVRLDSTVADRMVLAESITQKCASFERYPVLLCEEDPFEDIEKYGMDIYVKCRERRNCDS